MINILIKFTNIKSVTELCSLCIIPYRITYIT